MPTPEAMFGLIMGFLVAWFLEKRYIGRFGVLPNVAGIFFLLSPYWIVIPNYIQIWTFLGFGFGSLGIYFRVKNIQFSPLHTITYPLYSGKTIMGIYTSILIIKDFFPNFLFSNYHYLFALALIIIIWYIGVKYLSNDPPLS